METEHKMAESTMPQESLISYCSSCGKRLDTGAAFCKYCGTQVKFAESENLNEEKQINEKSSYIEAEIDGVMQSKTETVSKKKRQAGLFVTAIIATIVLSIVGILYFCVDKEDGGNIAYYSLPELSDAIIFAEIESPGFWGDETSIKIANAQNHLIDIGYINKHGFLVSEPQISRDGTIAARKGDMGEVHIYKNGVESIIPASVSYYYLSGSGEKIIYGSGEQDTYVWDVASEQSEVITESERAYGSSYNGYPLHVGVYGTDVKKLKTFGYITDMSLDGRYIYYNSPYDFGIVINGNEHRIYDYTNEDAYYSTRVIAHSSDYKEILFETSSGIYYFSLDLALKKADYRALRINAGVYNGEMLYSLEDMDAARTYGTRNRASHSITNNLYCLGGNGYLETVTIVRLSDNLELEEVISDVTSALYLSQDGTKLWCVSDGRAAFYDLLAESPQVHYCKGINIDRGEASIAMTSDGLRACFVGDDGVLWMCEADAAEEPEPIAENVIGVWCSAEDDFYFIIGDSAESWIENFGICGDLYMLNKEGELIFQFENVCKVCMTKSNMYILCSKTEEELDQPYELYYQDEDKYYILSDKVSYFSGVWGIYWGSY